MRDRRKLLPFFLTFILAFIAVPGGGNHSHHPDWFTKQLPDHEKAGWTPIPNLAAALKGYNPFIGGRFVSGDPDRGIRSQIFESTYIDEEGTPKIYGNIRVADDIHCSVDSKATVARNMRELEEQTQLTELESFLETKTESSKQGFIFNYNKHRNNIASKTRTSSFAKRNKFFEETQGEVYLNQASCPVFKVDIESTKPTFTGGFIAEMRKLQKALIAGQNWAVRSFIGRYGTHYMRESWLGAKMTTMTWMTSKSKDRSERARRQRCVSAVYLRQTAEGVKIPKVDINLQGSLGVSGGKNGVSGDGQVSGGLSTTIGGGGWGYGNTYATDTERCDSRGYSSHFFAQNQFQRTEIISVGALPVSDRDQWYQSTKDAPSVVKMALAPISELFEPSYVNDILLDPSNPSRGNLDADLLKRSFTNIMENYCQLMLGEDCPPANGCALYGLCGDGEVCRDDTHFPNGFRCECVDCVTVSSTGGAADRLPESLGVYKKTTQTWSGRPVWQSTVRDDRFLFYNGDWSRWVISNELSNDGTGANTIISKKKGLNDIPLTGWHYGIDTDAFGTGTTWFADDTLRVREGVNYPFW